MRQAPSDKKCVGGGGEGSHQENLSELAKAGISFVFQLRAEYNDFKIENISHSNLVARNCRLPAVPDLV